MELVAVPGLPLLQSDGAEISICMADTGSVALYYPSLSRPSINSSLMVTLLYTTRVKMLEHLVI
jgi:hypothetical protein